MWPSRTSWFISALVALLGWSVPSLAEMIHLKDGKTLQAKITKRTDQAVTIDWYGVPVTYWLDEVEGIEADTEHVSQRVGAQATPPAPAAEPVETSLDQAALIQEVLQHSGLQDQINKMQAQILDQMAQRQTEIPPEVYAKLSVATSDAFRYETITTSVISSFNRHFDQEKLSKVLEWLRLPSTQQMTELERIAQSSGVDAVKAFAEELTQQPPSGARLALLQRLSDATQAPDLLQAMSMAIVGGMTDTAVAETQATPEEVAAAMKAFEAKTGEQFKNALEANVLGSFLFTYRSTSDGELERYVEFWESDLGKWFNELGSESLTSAVREAASRMARALIALAEEQQKKAKAAEAPAAP